MTMSLPDRLKADLKAAMKAREADRTGALRLLLSRIRYAEIDRKKPLTEGEILQLIQKSVRDRREAAEMYRKGGRAELAEKEEREAGILGSYLPEPITGAELERTIVDLLDELGISEKRKMGVAMKTLMERFQGRVDGSEASRLLAGKLT
jgi:uncharacterized protein YqeY